MHRKLNEHSILKILNVNSSLGLKIGGGTAERTFQMSRFLASQSGIQCTVLTLDIDLDAMRIRAIQPAKVVQLPCLWSRFYVPRGGWQAIKQLVDESDVIHLMGHWSVLNLMVYTAARRANKPYVVCPAGALPLFGRSTLLKRIYNFFAGRAIVKNAKAWIAVTAGELSHFEAYGVPSSRVLVIPNGVDEKDFPETDKHQFLVSHKLPEAPILLFMGRLNPIKGPDLLLQAFIQVRDQFPGFHLVFVGPDGGMLSQLKMAVSNEGISDRVHFLGYLSGSDKAAAYRCARMLVVPSRQEAMSIVAIEAGICGTPVLITDQCGFDEVLEIDRRWVVSATVSGLAEGLCVLLRDDHSLTQVSKPWRKFVAQRYSWENIVSKYVTLYNGLLDQSLSSSPKNRLQFKAAFPLAFLVNNLSMTAMMVAFAMVGEAETAAEIGLIQASTSALFYAFSTNARSIILSADDSQLSRTIVSFRLILSIPLVAIAYLINSNSGWILPVISMVFITRRLAEWISEVDLSERERMHQNWHAYIFIFLQIILFIIVVANLLFVPDNSKVGLIAWAVCPLIFCGGTVVRGVKEAVDLNFEKMRKMLPHFGSSVAIGASLYIFRSVLASLLGKVEAGMFFSAYAIGGIFGALTFTAFGPSIALAEKTGGRRFKISRSAFVILWSSFWAGLGIVVVAITDPSQFDWASKPIYYWQAIGYSMMGGVIMVYAQVIRNRILIHDSKSNLFGPDLAMNVILILTIPVLYAIGGSGLMATLSLYGACLAFLFYKNSSFNRKGGFHVD